MKRFICLMLAIMLILSTFVIVSADETSSDTIKIVEDDKTFVKKLVYEENFDGTGAGEDVKGFVSYTKPDSSNGAIGLTSVLTEGNPESFFKVANGVSNNSTNVGMLDYPRYISKEARRTDENGTYLADAKPSTYKENITISIATGGTTNATVAGHLGRDYYSITFPEELQNAKRVVVELDVYNAATSWDDGTPGGNYTIENKAYSRDTLTVSMGKRGLRHTQASEAPYVQIDADKLLLRGKSDTDNDYSTGSAVANPYSGFADKSEKHSAQPRTWNKLVYEIEKLPDYTYTDSKGAVSTRYHVATKATYGGVTLTNEVYKAYANELENFIINVENSYGGRFYIDNLKIYKVEEYGCSIDLDGESRICYGQKGNTYTYTAKVYENGEVVNGAQVIYSLEGDVPSTVSLNGNKIIVTGELPKDTHIVLKATLEDDSSVYATKTITLQDQATYLADNNRFNTLLEHIENIYKYSGDDINNSSIMSMVIDRNSLSPGFWVASDKSEYIPCDLGSMGNFLRAVDSVGFLTGNKEYNNKVDSIYKAWINNFSGDNGLPYWGAHTCADMLSYTKREGTGSQHELKYHFPYMEPFFRLNSEYAENMVIQAWSEHISDWDKMMFNRHGTYKGSNKNSNITEWNNNTESFELTEPSYDNVNISGDLSFSSAGIDLAQLATDFYKNTKDENAKAAVIKLFDGFWKICGNDEDMLLNVPQNSTAGRYGYDAAPGVKDISSIAPDGKWWLVSDSTHTTTSWGDRWWNAYGDDLIAQGFITEDQQWVVRECYSKFSGEQEQYYPFTQWDYINAVGPDTEEGKILLDRTIRAHANYIRMAYNPERNEFKKIFIDGTDITGFKMTRNFYGSTAGNVMGWGSGGTGLLLGTVYNYLNAVDYPEYKDDTDILWSYIRNYMDKKGFGNLGTTEPGENISLNFETSSAECDYMLAMIYLYQHTGISDYLDMARLIADNITESYMVDGMFTNTPNGRYIYIGGENGEYPYAFALLEATIRGEEAVVPLYHPCSGFREDNFYEEETDTTYVTKDAGYIYGEEYSEYDKSVKDFKEIEVNNEKKTITFADEHTGSSKVNVTLYVISGTNASVKAYDTDNNEIGSVSIDTSVTDRRQNLSINVVGKSLKSISIISDGLLFVNDIKIEKTYKGDIIFEEHFEDYKVGENVPGYTDYNYYISDALYSTFTTSKNIGGNATQVGNVYNPSCYRGRAVRVMDDGTPDKNKIAVEEGMKNGLDFFSIPIDMNDTPNLRLEFKMYNAGNALHETVGTVKDEFRIGLVPSRQKHCYASEVVWAIIAENTMTLGNREWGYNETTGKEQFTGTEVPGTHGLKAKQWMDVVLEVRRIKKPVNGTEKLCSEVSLTVGGETIRSIVEGQEESEFGNLAFGVSYYHGGRIYIDDIMLYALSPLEEEDDALMSADVLKMKGENCTIVGLGEKDELTAGNLSYVTLRTSSETPRVVNVLTALYNDGILDSYSIDEINTEDLGLYEDTRVNLNTLITVPEEFENYYASVMLFDSLDTLIPLADRFDLKIRAD